MTQGGVRTRTRAHLAAVNRDGYWEAERCTCAGREDGAQLHVAHARDHGSARFLSAMTLSVRISARCLPRQSLGEALR